MSGQIISYWIKQYVSGRFEPGVREQRVVISKIVCQRDAELVCQILQENPNQSSVSVHRKLKADGYTGSLSTTKRLIKKCGFTSSRARYGQMVRDVNKEKRVDFCTELIRQNDPLNDVIFTDECSVQLHQNKMVTYRRTGHIGPVLPKPKHPLKVHVWGGISRRGKTSLVIFEGIMEKTFFTNTILRDTLLPHIKKVFPDGHRLQQDNDPKHKSKMAKDFMAASGINHWDTWPSGKS